MSTLRVASFLMLSVFALLFFSVNSNKSSTTPTPILTAEQQELNIPEIHQERSLTGKEKVLSWILKRKIKREIHRQQKANRTPQGDQVSNESLPMNNLAEMAGLAGGLSLLSIIALSPVVFILLTLAALILGIIALIQFKRHPGRWRGKGWAIFGIALTAFWIVSIVLFL